MPAWTPFQRLGNLFLRLADSSETSTYRWTTSLFSARPWLSGETGRVLSLVAAQASGGFTFVWVGTGRLYTNLLDAHHFLNEASC